MTSFPSRCVFGILLGFSAISLAQQPTDRPAQGRLASIEKLKLSKLPGGGLPTYYSAGYAKRAVTVQSYVEQERAFYRKELGVQLADVRLAVLDGKDWGPVSAPMPYGMPSVEGHPRVIVMPADWDTVTIFSQKEADTTEAVRAKARATGKPWAELLHTGLDGIGAHEVGHAIVEEYGIDAPTKWLNEFLASYVGDVFVTEKRPQEMDGNRIFWEASLAWPHKHSSLDYFELHYDDLTNNQPMNYGWYQCAFDQRVVVVHQQEGVSFLRKMKAAFPVGGPKMTNAQVLEKLEAIEPGWKAWAAKLEADKI